MEADGGTSQPTSESVSLALVYSGVGVIVLLFLYIFPGICTVRCSVIFKVVYGLCSVKGQKSSLILPSHEGWLLEIKLFSSGLLRLIKGISFIL